MQYTRCIQQHWREYKGKNNKAFSFQAFRIILSDEAFSTLGNLTGTVASIKREEGQSKSQISFVHFNKQLVNNTVTVP